jgi:hypothetical protein
MTSPDEGGEAPCFAHLLDEPPPPTSQLVGPACDEDGCPGARAAEAAGSTGRPVTTDGGAADELR